MAKDPEAQIEEGQAILDTIRTDGWRILEAKIKEEIEDERRELVEVEAKDVYSAAVKFISHQQKMKGLERILEIVGEFLTAKKDAENWLRGEK